MTDTTMSKAPESSLLVTALSEEFPQRDYRCGISAAP